MKNSVVIAFLLALLITQGFSQDVPLGTWRSHLNYTDTRLLVVNQNKIYAASEFGFYYYDLEDNSLNKLTKNDGFSDVGITAMASIPGSGGLVIGYQSGMIDILEDDNSLTGIDAIKRSAISDAKAINDILFYNDLAYLITDFGLVALDYQKKEIKENYSNIGANGTTISANAGEIYQDSIFLATQEGIIATSLDPLNNLLDFNNWKRFTLNDGPGANIQAIESFNGYLYTGIDQDSIYHYKENQWEKLKTPHIGNLIRMQSIEETLYILTSEGLFLMNTANEISKQSNAHLPSLSDVVKDDGGRYWYADRKLGLVLAEDGSYQNFSLSGPFSDHISKLIYFDDRIAALESGFTTNFLANDNPAAFSLFYNGSWENYSSENTPLLAEFQDLTNAAYSGSTNTVYFSSFGNGVFEWRLHDNSFHHLDGPFNSRRITAAAADGNANIYFTEYGANDILYAYDENQNEWSNFAFGTSGHALELISLPLGQQWIRLDRNLLVMEAETGTTNLLTTDSDNLIDDQVNDLVVDKDGFVWYGTNQGLAYIPNPGDALTTHVSSIIPIYENGSLFSSDQINALAIDGGNRKWIATNNGLWLFKEETDEVIHHFTEENSPLLSNDIIDIAINARSGEVFIATAKGLVSFRSTASEGSLSHNRVKIFPNPVKENYNGSIGIIGVVENAVIKITDLSGNLVRELSANGGTASWDGNDLSGSRVNTGIYLVYSASSDGKENYVGKLAFIR